MSEHPLVTAQKLSDSASRRVERLRAAYRLGRIRELAARDFEVLNDARAQNSPGSSSDDAGRR